MPNLPLTHTHTVDSSSNRPWTLLPSSQSIEPLISRWLMQRHSRTGLSIPGPYNLSPISLLELLATLVDNSYHCRIHTYPTQTCNCFVIWLQRYVTYSLATPAWDSNQTLTWRPTLTPAAGTTDTQASMTHGPTQVDGTQTCRHKHIHRDPLHSGK